MGAIKTWLAVTSDRMYSSTTFGGRKREKRFSRLISPSAHLRKYTELLQLFRTTLKPSSGISGRRYGSSSSKSIRFPMT